MLSKVVQEQEALQDFGSTTLVMSARKLPQSQVLRLFLTCVLVCVGVSLVLYYGCALSVIGQTAIALEQKQIEIDFVLDQSLLKEDPVLKPSYLELSPKQRDIYRTLYQAAWLHRDMVQVSGVSANEVWEVFTRLRYDSPELFDLRDELDTASTTTRTLSTNTVVEVGFSYLADQEATSLMRERMARSIALAMEAVGVASDEQTKAALLHDWLCEQVMYGEGCSEELAHSAYGALCEGQAVCEGYALAYGLLCNKAGLSNRVIVGHLESTDDPTIGHAWNAVTCDGVELYVDSTTNDGRVVSHKYLLRDANFMEREGYIPYENNFPTL